MLKTVMVAGKFDPLHDFHILHIQKASALGNYLYVVTHSDEVLKKIKGRVNIPLWARVDTIRALLSFYGIKGTAICSIDEDGTVVKTLEYLRPTIFAKGGDRTPDNMPNLEVEVCKRIGCEIVYGVGETGNSSSKITDNIVRSRNGTYLITDCKVEGVAFSETTLHPHQETRGHSHENSEIYYFPSSGGVLIKGEDAIPTKEGMVKVIEPNEFHMVRNLMDTEFKFVCTWREKQ